MGNFEVQDDVVAGGHGGTAGDCHSRGRIRLREERAVDLSLLVIAYVCDRVEAYQVNSLKVLH